MKKRRRSMKERMRIEVDGVLRRLQWVAEHRPEILLGELCGRMQIGYLQKDVVFSAFANVGMKRLELEELIKQHPEWETLGIDLETFRDNNLRAH